MTVPANDTPSGRPGRLVLAGCSLLMVVFGSLHAFSVFLFPLETGFGVSRADASLTYSLALAVTTVMVLFGHRLFGLLSPAGLIVALSVVGVGGTTLAGHASDIGTVWLGFGVLFGAANGVGYGFCLQFAGQANPSMRGGAMGLVTAAYGLGAALAPVPLAALLERFGLQGGMWGLAAAIGAVGPVVALMFARSGLRLRTEAAEEDGGRAPTGGEIARMWFAYGAAVAAGLMAIGHATGIAEAAGLSAAWIVAAPVAIAAANVIGSCLGGWLVDAVGPRRLLQGMATLSAAALAAMTFIAQPHFALVGLALVGFAYGATIAAFPAAIAGVYGPVEAIRAYGRVFTSWGCAGLFAPWFAGVLYGRGGDYAAALTVAAALGVASALALKWFPHRR